MLDKNLDTNALLENNSFSRNTKINDAERFEFHIEVTTNDSQVLALLSAKCAEAKGEFSNGELKQAIAKGALWLTQGNRTQRLRRIKKKLQVGDTLHFYFNQAVLAQTTQDAKLIADHQDYSIWYKPYGMLSQGSKWSDHLTIERFVQSYFSTQGQERATFIVHRLDRAATGLIIIAHSKKAARALSAMFEIHNLEKRYHIIVHGRLPTSATTPIKVSEAIDGKNATSHFRQLAFDQEKNISLLEVLIETGRKHQIRKHAAHIGLPVVGDRLHGDKSQSYTDELNLQLCAQSLKFDCPITGEIRAVELPVELCPNIEKVRQLL